MQLCMIRLKVGVFEVLQGEATMMYCCSNSKCVCVCVCLCVPQDEGYCMEVHITHLCGEWLHRSRS